jgi:hypothetical protein
LTYRCSDGENIIEGQIALEIETNVKTENHANPGYSQYDDGDDGTDRRVIRHVRTCGRSDSRLCGTICDIAERGVRRKM